MNRGEGTNSSKERRAVTGLESGEFFTGRHVLIPFHVRGTNWRAVSPVNQGNPEVPAPSCVGCRGGLRTNLSWGHRPTLGRRNSLTLRCGTEEVAVHGVCGTSRHRSRRVAARVCVPLSLSTCPTLSSLSLSSVIGSVFGGKTKDCRQKPQLHLSQSVHSCANYFYPLLPQVLYS